MDEAEQQFSNEARAIELLVAAANQIEMVRLLLGPSRILDVALQCLHYVLSQINETETPRN